MLDLVPINHQLLLYLGQLLHIVTVVLQSQLGCLQVEADAEVPSTFGHKLERLTCKCLLTQRIPVFMSLLAAINEYFNARSFVQLDHDVGIGSFAGFDAEFRLPQSV